MRRLILLVMLAFIITIVTGVSPGFAREGGNQTDGITVLLDGLQLGFDVPPVIQDGRTLVPFRAIAEALGVEVTWDGLTRRVIADDGGISVRMEIGSKIAYLNKVSLNMDVSPVIINGRTLIPARFLSEAFGCEVEWIADSRTVEITSPTRMMSVTGFYALGDAQTSSWTDLFTKDYPKTDKGNTGVISDLALGWYSLDEEGNLLSRSRNGWQRPEGWEKVLEAAQEYELKTDMVVHVTNKEARISKLLINDTAVDKAINSIVKEAKLYNGVNLDFEGLGWQDSGEQLDKIRHYYNNFVRKLSQQLKKADLKLSLTLHAPNSAYQGYDYYTLGKLADQIIIMAYDYGPKPEPVTLVTQAVEMAKKVVPQGKLVLGISIPSETPESLAHKIDIARAYKLNGIALWRLGLLSEHMWDVLRDNEANISKHLTVRGDAIYNLYSRPEPATLAGPPGQVQGGDRVQLINQQASWSEVQKGWLKGWIPSWYLEAGDKIEVKDIEPQYLVVKHDDKLYLNPDGEVLQDIKKGKLLKVTQEYGDWRYADIIVYSIPAIQKAWVKAEILADPEQVTPREGYLAAGTEVFEEVFTGGRMELVKEKLTHPMVVSISNQEKDGLVAIASAGGWTAWTEKANIQFAPKYEHNATISGYHVSLDLPEDWKLIQRHEARADLLNKQDKTVGAVELLEGEYLPNHSEIVSETNIITKLGEGRMVVLKRSLPAASGIQKEWLEIHVLLPFNGPQWLDLWLSLDSRDKINNMQEILKTIARDIQITSH